MKKLLAIDTSTEQASIALLVFDKLFSKTNPNVKQHADCILPMISELLLEADLNLKDLDGIVFGCGPGSFTGIRVSCSIAKALAYAHSLPMYPVTSLHAIAYTASEGNFTENTSFLALLDARMQEFYWQYFSDLQVGKPEVASLENIVIPDTSKLVVCGPNIKLFIENLSQHVQNNIFEVKEVFPIAADMIRLVQKGYISPVTANQALPLYVRNKVVASV